MNLLRNTKLLLQFGFRPIRGDTHASRLESFYSYQAEEYDDFREHFLRGRKEMLQHLSIPSAARWVDLGCGTGYLLKAAGKIARQCECIWLVDVTPSLLDRARKRVEQGGWSNVEIVEEDAAHFSMATQVDCITFSYSLTMMPQWFLVVDRAYEMLRPGGRIGVADFFVSRKHPEGVAPRQRWATRHFWPAWFAWDNVHPSSDHIPYLESKFDVTWFHHERTRVPGLPFLRPPCYQLVGVKT